ncbi:MATE family efflux transporter [Winogradskyella sediminis]|uniref:MATE family efflux transporter n=1 Tax=Winogradskyella sediminis TaxID=1382466 RepID=UPI000E239186|nr:MATE family efflux transporter [Winogradskyella sediminis]REG89318.1 Na+-driven multidrug efflux pump [Winogradskyella sediminis]
MVKGILKRLKDNDLANKSFQVLSIRVFGVVLSFTTLLLITNNFQEDLVGKYNYLNSILVVLGSISLLGMNSSFLQFSGMLDAQNEFQEVVNIYKKKIKILIISCAVLISIYLLIKPLISEYLKEIQINVILEKAFIGLFFYAISLLNYEVVRGLKKLIQSEFYRNILRFGTLFVVVIILIYLDREDLFLDLFIATFILTAIITSINVIIILKKITSKKAVGETRISYKKILSVSLPMTISFLALLIMQSIDVIMLKNYYEYHIVAYYGVVMRVSFLISIVLMSINAIISPLISKLFFSEQKRDLIELMNKSIKLNFLLTLPLILLLLIFPKFVLSFFGDNYQDSSNVLIIILLGQIINVFSGSVGVYLNMTGRQLVFQRILLVTLVINVLLNLTLIPVYDMVGAAISTSISLIVWNITGVIYIYKKDKILLFINRSVFYGSK